MADRPILFSAPMVQALLDGRKTQTRRLFKGIEQMSNGNWHIFGGIVNVLEQDVSKHAPDYARIQPGDRLYVREHWRTSPEHDDTAPRDLGGGAPICFLADTGITFPSPLWGRHRQAMHMPRWASRLTLTVADVRVERLQDISEDDAAAEGWPAPEDRAKTGVAEIRDAYPIGWYAWLWDNINGSGAWNANPWIVAYTFTVEHGNIDRIGGA